MVLFCTVSVYVYYNRIISVFKRLRHFLCTVSHSASPTCPNKLLQFVFVGYYIFNRPT